MRRPCASVATGQVKSGASRYVPSAPTHQDWVQGFRQAGLGGAHRLGRPSTAGLSSALGNLGHGFLTSTTDWEQREPWSTGLAPGAGRVWGRPITP